MSWFRTVSFGLVQLTGTMLLQLWCGVVHTRFRGTHPGEVPAAITAWCWAWASVAPFVALVLSLALATAHLRGSSRAYDAVYYLGYWLLVVWAGFMLVAMEVSFVPIRE